MNVYPFIAAEQAATHHVTTACALLEVSTSAYYQWSRHLPSARARADAELGERIERIHRDSRGTYGVPQVHRDGVCCGRKRVARLMQAARLHGVYRRHGKRHRPAPAVHGSTNMVKPSMKLSDVGILAKVVGPSRQCHPIRRHSATRSCHSRCTFVPMVRYWRGQAAREIEERGIPMSCPSHIWVPLWGPQSRWPVSSATV